jgi:LEA14-like dessication related protein
MKTRSRITLRGIVVALLLGGFYVGGCSLFVPKFERPTFSIVGIDMLKSDILEQHIRVRMRVQNPNDRALPVKGLAYDIELQGQEFAHGVSANAFTVPALGEAEFDMNLTANTVGALAILFGRRGGGSEGISYRISGKVSLASGLKRTVPFEQKGTFNLR